MSRDILNHDLDGENTRPMVSVDKVRELSAESQQRWSVALLADFPLKKLKMRCAEREELNLLQVSRDKKTITFVYTFISRLNRLIVTKVFYF